jgi:hypothetical protein
MQERCWTASWRNQDGEQRSYTFEAQDVYSVAELYFRHQLRDHSEQRPASYELTKGPLVPRFVPKRQAWEGRS